MNPNMTSLPIPKTKVSWTLGFQTLLLLALWLTNMHQAWCTTGQPGMQGFKSYNQADWTPVYHIRLVMAGMICHQKLQLSLDATGKAKITPGMVLVSPHGPESGFKVKVYGLSNDTVTCQQKGQTIKVELQELATGNRCWTFILIEDKLAPTVLCRDTTLLCTGTLEYLDSIPGLYTIADNCTPSIYLKVTHSDQIQMMDCGNDTFSMVRRTWTVIDPWGRLGSCTQKISLLRPSKSDIDFPNDTVIYCPDINTSPELVGQPTLNGQPLDKFCGWSLRFDDVIFAKCGQTKKIFRTWSVLDCCSLTDTTVSQLIQISDTTRPVIVCLGPDTISTFTNCEAKYVIPAILSAYDSCHGNSLTTIVRVDGLQIAVPGSILFLEMGSHTLQYIVSDPCGNSSTCTVLLEVVDKQAPGFWCIDSIQISLPADLIYLKASDFQSIEALDNCSLVGIELRRSADFCADGQDHTKYGDSVAFCCNDVNKTFNLIFLATDIFGNKDSCLVTAVVLDKLSPTLNCEQDTTIKCGDPQPAWKNPLLGLTDNCLDSVKIKIDTIINNINLCGIGQITRRIIATDKSNNRDTCFQTIRIPAGDTLLPSEILLIHDTLKIVGCRASLLLPDSIGYEPPAFEEPANSCNKLFVTFRDTLQPTAGTSRCRITKRTWRVGDSCFSFSPIKILLQVIIQDTTAFSPLQGGISGLVINRNSVPIEEVHIYGKNMQSTMVYDQMTGGDGKFSSTVAESALKLNLKKEDHDALNGISTLDLIWIQQHIAGVKYLDNPLLEYAADIDRNGAINVLDLIQLRKYILGFPGADLPWKFISSEVPLTSIQPGQSFPEEYMVLNTGKPAEFIGFRLGDVNSDARVNHSSDLESRSNRRSELVFEDSEDGLQLVANQTATLSGLQFSFKSHQGWQDFKIQSDVLSGLESQIKINGNEMRLSWVGKQSISIHRGSVILKLRGVHSKNIFSGSLNSEWYDVQTRVSPIQLNTKPNAPYPPVLVYPNPAIDQLNLQIDLASGYTHWRLIHPNGNVALQGKITNSSSPGTAIPIDIHSLSTGIFILELSTANSIKSRHKVLKIK